QRRIAIDRVGVKSLRHPVRVRCEGGALMHSVAVFDLSVRLPETAKGTHMSRFVELIESQPEPLSAATLPGLLEHMLARLDAGEGHITARFPFFMEKHAPISGVKSTLDYEVELAGEMKDGRANVATRVTIPVTSLCPCSKEISAYGAHNQRAHIAIRVEGPEPIAIESIIALAEAQASSALYGVLKRTDEKYVTERAYENPKFVEDVARDVAAALDADARVAAYVVEVENFESIHNHSAFAVLERRKPA
ncbi:MAG: GTP cyclohydrolase I FolE2, partial [Betaproteobacteria bacterium]|nr:GTP cyclohydrolase I FolE2 [Betaproteobacteria bacterium]